MAKNTSVFAIFNTRDQIEQVIDGLRLNGFRAEDISVLLPENIGNKEIGTEKNTKSPEGAAVGGAGGAVAGGVLAGWPASVHWPSLALARSSQRVRSWLLWQEWVRAPFGWYHGCVGGYRYPRIRSQALPRAYARRHS